MIIFGSGVKDGIIREINRLRYIEASEIKESPRATRFCERVLRRLRIASKDVLCKT